MKITPLYFYVTLNIWDSPILFKICLIRSSFAFPNRIPANGGADYWQDLLHYYLILANFCLILSMATVTLAPFRRQA